jgi:CheY-like chemotaxis protein
LAAHGRFAAFLRHFRGFEDYAGFGKKTLKNFWKWFIMEPVFYTTPEITSVGVFIFMETEAKRQKIMRVDDNVTNLTVGKNALLDKYDVFTIPSGEKLLKILERTIPDLILLDIDMPDMTGYDVIKILKGNPDTASIPVIFLTAKNDAADELTGLSLGAIDYIIKPFSPPLLQKRSEKRLSFRSLV